MRALVPSTALIGSLSELLCVSPQHCIARCQQSAWRNPHASPGACFLATTLFPDDVHHKLDTAASSTMQHTHCSRQPASMVLAWQHRFLLSRDKHYIFGSMQRGAFVTACILGTFVSQHIIDETALNCIPSQVLPFNITASAICTTKPWHGCSRTSIIVKEPPPGASTYPHPIELSHTGSSLQWRGSVTCKSAVASLHKQLQRLQGCLQAQSCISCCSDAVPVLFCSNVDNPVNQLQRAAQASSCCSTAAGA